MKLASKNRVGGMAVNAFLCKNEIAQADSMGRPAEYSPWR